MSVPLFGLTVTFAIKGTPTGADADGNDTYTTTNRVVPGCVYAPGGSVEVLGNQDTVTTQPTVYAPTGTVLGAIDQAIVPGYGTFEVDGLPQAWPRHPQTGWLPPNSVVVRLKNVTG